MANWWLWRLAGSLVIISLAPFAAQAVPSGYERDVRAYNLAYGRVIFTDKCMYCHETGKRGAPVLGNSKDWAERLQKPLSELIKNAQEGHGDMPPKGDQGLTDKDVAAAVAYVAHHSRRVLADSLNRLAATAAGDTGRAQPAELNTCSARGSLAPCVVKPPAHDVVFNMFLMLIGQERWK